MNNAINLSTAVGITLMIAVLLAVAVSSRDYLEKQNQSQQLVMHTHQILSRLETVLLRAEEAVNGQSGYIITGDAKFLEPQKTTRLEVQKDVSQIQELTRDSVDENKKVVELGSTVNAIFNGLDKLQNSRGASSAAVSEQVKGMQVQMAELRNTVDSLKTLENTNMAQRSDKLQSDTRHTSANLLLFAGLAIAFQILLTYLISSFLRARKHAEAKLKSVLESIAEGVIQVDAEGKVVYLNAPAARLLGKKTENVLGCYLPDTVDYCNTEDSNRASSSKTLTQVLKDKKTFSAVEGKFVTPDGTVMAVRTSAAPLVDGDKAVGAVVSFQDVTDRRQRQARITLQHSITDLLTNSDSPDLALDSVLEAICENLGWMVGQLWLIDSEEESLHCDKLYWAGGGDASEFSNMFSSRKFKKGEGFPGHIWRTAKPDWITDISNHLDFKRVEAATTAGVNSVFAFPVNVGGRVYGVMEFFCNQLKMMDDEFIATFAAIAGMIGQFLDRATALDELKNSETKFRAVFNQTYQFMGVISSEGVLLDGNDTAFAFQGVKKEDVLGKLFWDTPWWQHDTGLQEKLKNAVAIARTGKTITFEAHHVNDDRTVIVDFSLKPVMDSKGTVLFLVAEGREITDRVKYAQELADREARIQAIFDTAPDGIVLMSIDGVIEKANVAAHRIFKYEEKELVGKLITDLIPDFFDEVEVQRSLEESAYTTGSFGVGVEITGLRKNGRKIPIDLNTTAITISNRRLITGILRDITERKEVEKRVSEFYSMISHELRTPLTSIRGSLGLLEGGRAGDMSDRAKNLVTIARSESDRLIRLINEILDIRKIEAGMLELKYEPVDPNEMVRQTVDVLQTVANNHRIKLKFEKSLDIQVNCDRDRIVQVLTNLTSNAIKFSTPGQEVEIKVERDVFQFCKFTVVDHGQGIDSADHHKLFGLFQQVDSSDTRAKEGTGLGLAISKAIVEQHGGHISFISAFGAGSTFSFEIPIHKPSMSDLVSTVPTKAFVPSRNCPSVLLIEDDVSTRDILKHELEPLGVECMEADNGLFAIDIVKKHSPDIIVLDIAIPGIDGFELVKRLQEDNVKTPLIVYTARDLTDDERAQLTLGESHHLTKSRTSSSDFALLIQRFVQKIKANPVERESVQ